MLTEYDEDELSFRRGAEEYRVGVVKATADKGAGDNFGDIVYECWWYVAECPNVVES